MNNIDVTIERMQKNIIGVNIAAARKQDPKKSLLEFGETGNTLMVDLQLYLREFPEDEFVTEKKHELNIHIIDFKLAVAESKYNLLGELADKLLAGLGDLQNHLEKVLGKPGRKREAIQEAVQKMKRAA